MRSNLTPIDPPDLHYYRAAQGWLELGNLDEANAELDNISSETRLHPDVLEIQWHICARQNQWAACVVIGSILVSVAPERSDSWIHHTFALHSMGRTKEALDILVPVAVRFFNVWHVPYNLSCYCTAIGRFDDAQGWLKIALSIDEKSAQKACLEDPDLQPLWAVLGTTLLKEAE
jgi:hypothetical protein